MPSEGNSLGTIVGIMVVLAVIVGAAIASVATIPAGHRGVVTTFGAVKDGTLNEGLHFVTPFADHVNVMTVQSLKYEFETVASTKDLLDVSTKVAVNYKLDAGYVNKLFQEVGYTYETVILAPAAPEEVKAATAAYTAEELITKRPAVKQKIEDSLRARMATRGIIIESISIVNLEFPEQFNNAITEKQTAEQEAIKAENILKRIQIEAQQKAAAAKGDADAIREVESALAQSPNYIEWQKVQKWDGKLPLATGNGAIPFIEVSTNDASG